MLRVERRHCPHCDKFVAFKTYKIHKLRYFDLTTCQWIKTADRTRHGEEKQKAVRNEPNENPPSIFPGARYKGRLLNTVNNVISDLSVKFACLLKNK